MAPAVTLAVGGVTAMEVRVGGGVVAAVTVRAAVPLTPLSEAVMVAEPAATPVAMPAELMVAAAVEELVQEALEVTLAVDPSL